MPSNNTPMSHPKWYHVFHKCRGMICIAPVPPLLSCIIKVACSSEWALLQDDTPLNWRVQWDMQEKSNLRSNTPIYMLHCTWIHILMLQTGWLKCNYERDKGGDSRTCSGRCVIIFWPRLPEGEDEVRITLVMSSIYHASSLSKSSGKTAHKAIKLRCITSVSGKCCLIPSPAD